ncbi:malto-oligosyltrehalose synthase [Sphingomonas morindae]|uniref:Malto-oligosyltrehalose synthase n=1 Tax=Sphingomonas morindae TaxID=1541170 RepID=A0ABY4X470_9SPHN|nr:malto-oligosyltrehalose synthase [Sphingomonas morindae]USI71680.1 malto-oligosyltrehalose synthase [Sphingomonas morindae]
MTPRATYRVQFHKDFPFEAALPLVDYWADLGISHVYSSPIATARAGSNHGYDVVDPGVINPELGGEAGFRALAAALKARGIGIILDIVPNHVAVGAGDNDWWLDVLEKGEASEFAGFFDIDWHPGDPALDGKLLAPFLGAPYAEALASGDVVVRKLGERIAVVAYDTHVFPLRLEDQAALADADLGAITGAALHALCERQHWRLAWWRTAGDVINWRRFFDVSELAGIRVEEERVFDAVHRLPLKLYAQGLIDGVRVDHVDGLADPAGYCVKLRAKLEAAGEWRPADAAPGPAYLVVEKILGEGEQLDPAWRTDGTSGYDFMNAVAALLHDPRSADAFGALWHELSGRPADFASEELAARREILERNFAGQLDSVARALRRVALSDPSLIDLTYAALRRASADLICGFPVYRTYGTGDAAPESDAPLRARAVARGQEIAGVADEDLVQRIADWLAGEGPGDLDRRREAVRRFQQLSAPIAAKAVEDTAFYRYGRLLSRNNVGFDPDRFGTGAGAFCRVIAERAAAHPHAMLATATHDHKRGEDVYARLAVLSERPERWAGFARRWAGLAPTEISRGDADILHQLLIGAWPLALAADDADGLAAFAERMSAWQLKALREAKLRTSWTVPDTDYEAACDAYLQGLLKPDGVFVREAIELVGELAAPGAAKGLVQAALRCTVPGVPDLYQGCEFWDLSLVDPDNRRPVDYEARRAALAAGRQDWRSGAAKQALIAALLTLRRERPALFLDGTFERLTLEGARAYDAIAFTRSHEGQTLTLLAAVHSAEVVDAGETLRLPDGWWGDTRLPDGRAAEQVSNGAVVRWLLD